VLTQTSCTIQDAQSIAITNAVRKGSSAGLIASLAFSSSDLLTKEQNSAKGNSLKKWKLYSQYKSDMLRALGYCYQGMSLLQDEEGGKARRCTMESVYLCEQAINSARQYDGAKPRTKGGEHSQYDAAMQKFVMDTDRRTERENAIVHMKPVPSEVPTQMEGRDVAHPIMPTTLPKPEEYTAIDIADKESYETKVEGKHPLWKWLLLPIALPLSILASILGCIVWVVLLPVKTFCFCCCVGQCAQLIWDQVEWLMKAPMHAIRWSADDANAGGLEHVGQAQT